MLLAFLLGALSNGANAPLALAQGEAVISFHLRPCSDMMKAKLDFASVSYSFWPTGGGGSADTVKTLWDLAEQGNASWAGVARSSLHLDVVLPSGFYHYVISAASDDHRTGCEQQWYLAVLPGQNQSVEGVMENGVVDPVTQVLIAGAVPEGVSAKVVRYDGHPPCGTVTAKLKSHALLHWTTVPGAYYAVDDYFTAKHAGAIAFGLQLSWPNGNRRTVRLLAEYPNEIISGAPTFRRFDVTESVARRVLSEPQALLVCAAV